jgi:hypothetical protein
MLVLKGAEHAEDGLDRLVIPSGNDRVLSSADRSCVQNFLVSYDGGCAMKYVIGFFAVIGLIASGIAGVIGGAYLVVKFMEAMDEYGVGKVFFIAVMIACACMFVVFIFDKSEEKVEKEEKVLD